MGLSFASSLGSSEFESIIHWIIHWILNRFLLVNSEMWIRMAIKLPHDLGVCQKTVGNLAGDFYGQHRHPGLRSALKNGAKHLLNGNGDALNTLFWWRKCCNYGSWEGHSLCSFWRIFGAWWNRYKYVFNTAKYARCYSHCPAVQNKREYPNRVKGFVETVVPNIVIQHLPRISGWNKFQMKDNPLLTSENVLWSIWPYYFYCELIIIADHCCCAMIL